jgi:hypothetical protein
VKNSLPLGALILPGTGSGEMMQTRDNEGYWREIATVFPWIKIDHDGQAGCMIRPPETELVLKTTKNSRLDPSPLGLTGQQLAPSEMLCRPPLLRATLRANLQPEFYGPIFRLTRCSA